MLVGGIILLCLAVGLFIAAQAQKKKAARLRGAELRAAGDLQETAQEISAELGAGHFSTPAMLMGRVECAQPLISPLAQRPCAYFEMRVTRKYEEPYWTKDNQGRQIQRTRTQTETINTNKASTRFHLVDDSGKVLVDPEQAELDHLTQTVSKFESSHQPVAAFGTFSLPLTGATMGHRTLGYEYTEKILPIDRPLTVIGTFNDKMGEPAMRHVKGAKLTISTRSQEEIVNSARKTSTVLTVIAGISGVGGLLLTILGAVA